MYKLIDFYGDANIGFYGRVSDKLFLSSFEKDFSEVLKVPSYKISIGGMEFVGLLSAMNSNGIVLPFIVKEEEIKKIKETGLDYLILKERFTALGNLILVNDKGAIVSELISKKSLQQIKDTLKVEVVQTSLVNSKIVGSVAFANNRGAILHRDAKEEDFKIIKDVLKVDAEIGSVNFGSPFVSSGIIANSNGALIGSRTSGYELDIIVRALSI